ITHESISYNASQITLSLQLAQPTDPRTDPVWNGENNLADIEWGLDTNGDGFPNAIAIYSAGFDGQISADIARVSNGGFSFIIGGGPNDQQCRGTTGSFDGTNYTITAPTNCIQNPARIEAVAGMEIDSFSSRQDLLFPGFNVQTDIAPDS